jgi:transcriptional regulator with GAF, ATPase, and Fis domain
MGLFETAEGSSVILDEIGNMSLDVQANLLRVLQERKVQRLGEYTLRDVDMRVISITNLDILKEIEAGRFRSDLYYRLNGFHIYVPPLRDREGDIPLLAEHFYQEACHEQKKELGGFDPGVLDMLASYPWPGNVRELQSEIQRACLLAQEGSCIETYHFSSEITHGEPLVKEIMSERLSYKQSVMRFRRRLVEEVLQECNGNRTHAAELLMMKRPNLVKLIKDLGL